MNTAFPPRSTIDLTTPSPSASRRATHTTVSSFFGEHLGDPRSDAAAGPGNDGYFVIQSHGNASLRRKEKIGRLAAVHPPPSRRPTTLPTRPASAACLGCRISISPSLPFRAPHAARCARPGHSSNRTGRNSTARTNAIAASTVMPSSRSGSEISHTIGNRIAANSASGQHSTKRMHQPTKSDECLHRLPRFENLRHFLSRPHSRPSPPSPPIFYRFAIRCTRKPLGDRDLRSRDARRSASVHSDFSRIRHNLESMTTGRAGGMRKAPKRGHVG